MSDAQMLAAIEARIEADGEWHGGPDGEFHALQDRKWLLARLRMVSDTHTIAYIDGQSLTAVCTCGDTFSVYGSTRTFAALLGQHIKEVRSAVPDGGSK